MQIYENKCQEIPEYWSEYLDKKIENIHKRQIMAGNSGTSFGVITDIHLSANAGHFSKILDKVLRDCSIPYFFDAGDFVSGKAYCPACEIIEDLKETQLLFRDILHKRLVVQGNHDAVFSTMKEPFAYAESIPQSAVYNYIYRYLASYPHICFSSSGMSYYADDIFHKIRYLALNTHEVPSDDKKENGLQLYNKSCSFFNQKQIEWFVKTALEVPTPDWSIVLCTHEIFNDSYPDPRGFGLVLDILDAFRRHTSCNIIDKCAGLPWNNNLEISADFNSRGGNVICWVGGHLHYDTIEKHNGIPVISVQNDSLLNSKNSQYTHERGTVSEQAFDIFTVDKSINKVYITRIGCGEDREFEYDTF